MPFDATNFRQPTVTVLPPTPPERGGPRRIRVEIEIVDWRGVGNFARPYRFGTFTLILFVLLLLAALAHAQPTSWQSHQEGFLRRFSGSDANGGQWTGSGYQQGFETVSEFNRPNGESPHCRSYELSGTVHTECDR